MKNTMQAALVAATFAATAMLGVGIAQAADTGLGVFVGKDEFGVFVNNRDRERVQIVEPAPDYYGDWYADPDAYHPYDFYRENVGATACFPVRKHGFDDSGHHVLIRARMCYDAEGKTYVVPGTREIIQRH